MPASVLQTCKEPKSTFHYVSSRHVFLSSFKNLLLITNLDTGARLQGDIAMELVRNFVVLIGFVAQRPTADVDILRTKIEMRAQKIYIKDNKVHKSKPVRTILIA